MRVLLAEDDELLGSGLKAGLGQQGFAVDWVRDGVAAERELLTQQHAVAEQHDIANVFCTHRGSCLLPDRNSLAGSHFNSSII